MTQLPVMKLKALVNFPAQAYGRVGIDIEKDAGAFYVDLDFAELAQISVVPPAALPTTYLVLWESTQDSYNTIVMSDLLAPIGIPEAPNDGVQYARQSLAWTATLPDAPSDGFSYGRLNAGWAQVAPLAALVVRSYLAGLGLSTPGASTSFTVQPGVAADSTSTAMMALTAALTKTTAAWAAGAGGALDTGAIAASTWYHVFLIQRVDTGVEDVLISLSPTAPTLPSPYTLLRRIGSLLTNGSSQWTTFSQFGDEFLYGTPFGDVNVATLGTTATLFVLTVPSIAGIRARLRGTMINATVGTAMLVNSPDEAVAAANAPLGNAAASTPVASAPAGFAAEVRVNASGQVRAVSSVASTTLRIATYGYFDDRGKAL